MTPFTTLYKIPTQEILDALANYRSQYNYDAACKAIQVTPITYLYQQLAGIVEDNTVAEKAQAADDHVKEGVGFTDTVRDIREILQESSKPYTLLDNYYKVDAEATVQYDALEEVTTYYDQLTIDVSVLYNAEGNAIECLSVYWPDNGNEPIVEFINERVVLTLEVDSMKNTAATCEDIICKAMMIIRTLRGYGLLEQKTVTALISAMNVDYTNYFFVNIYGLVLCEDGVDNHFEAHDGDMLACNIFEMFMSAMAILSPEKHEVASNALEEAYSAW